MCFSTGNKCILRRCSRRTVRQRACLAQRAAAARGASAPAPPPPPSSARMRCAPPASCPYLARRDPRKSRSAVPLRRSSPAACRVPFLYVRLDVARLLHTLPLSVCLSSCQSMIPVKLVCFTHLFCSARTCLLLHRHRTLSLSR